MNLFAFATFAALGIHCHASYIEQGYMTVTTESNTGVGGFMFDVEANEVMDITINTILFNFNAGKGSYEYGLWYKEGSFVGFNTDESAWTQACSGMSEDQNTCNGQICSYNRDFNSGTSKRDCSFTIPAGQTYGVYIHGLSRGLIVEKEGSSFDDIVASARNLKVHTGLGVASTYGPFGKGYGDDYYVTPTVKLMYTALFNDEEEDDCSIEVQSVDHKFGPPVVGKYFNFDKNALDTILGRSDWSNERLDTDKGTVVVWRNPNGGSVGDAHGRLDKSAKKGDWSVGDKITFKDCVTNGIEPEPCVGCFTDYDDLDSVQETVYGIADEIFALFNEKNIPVGNAKRLIVVSAQSQVVAGTNFRVTLNTGSQQNVIIQYFVALPSANSDQVPSNIQLIDEGHEYEWEAKQGEICKEGGVESGYLFERNCEKGLVCLPKKGVVAIGGEVPYTCQFA